MTERVVLITGASGNLGAAVARALAGEGAWLALSSRKAEDLAALSAELGTERCSVYPADVTQVEQVASMVAGVVAARGRIDVLVNLAGAFKGGVPIHEADAGQWDFLMDLNARAVWLTCRAVLPVMLGHGGGKIVNVAARQGMQAGKGVAAYAASKAAVIRLTEGISADVRDLGVNVNCVLPSTLDTPQNRAQMPNVDPAKWVTVDDLAHVIAFLASEGARAVHGAAVPVYGRA